ncbi:Arylsulfatase A [Fodinibius roseus]|uniref:Arylsulfatase A n=1 Tax=Fodinibius roseus TaxID=1194090 RepID=A0A1M4XVH2_9BACT|nr:sulfatase [Fodinibius roseus]SHE97415.1 Arylsulfatase A [Fodinibius roseus]
MTGKNWISLLLLGLVIACNTQPGQDGRQAGSEQPNIILFLVDDLGWQDTSVPFHKEQTPFNEFYQTPNMERLAGQGMLFTNAYSASPVCTPTRSSIITGKNPARTNITDWTLHNDPERMERTGQDYPVKSPDWAVEGVQPDSMLLTEVLKAQGYRTIHVGKAHFGALRTPGADPTNLGFDVNIAGHAAGAPGSYWPEDNYGNEEPGSAWAVPRMEDYYDSEANLTEALTIEANKAIDNAVEANKPFYMNMAHYTVHAPIMADRRYYEDYLEAGVDSVEAKYASMVEGMDSSLGSIWQNLKEEDIAENTIILFMSDNGGLSAHTRGTTPMGTGLNTHNKPLRSGKGSAYEGGIRVPMIAAWAERAEDHPLQSRFEIQPGSRNETPIISEDFYPAILELAGLDSGSAAFQSTDGRSFIPLLRSGKAPGTGEDRALAWHYPHKWGPSGPGYEPFTAIRDGQWKLIYFYKDQEWELYNLEEDIGEANNLIEEEKKVAMQLAEQMRAWMQEVGAQTPVSRETGDQVALPKISREMR